LVKAAGSLVRVATTGLSGRAMTCAATLGHGHLLSVDDLSAGDVSLVLDEATRWLGFNRGARKRADALAGLTVVNAFFESSTRTLLSFEIAAKRLGGDVVNLQAAQSSIAKGETLDDTIRTIGAMQPDLFIIRHQEPGTARDAARLLSCPVVNAGDGDNEHPTQALLDALTIRQRKGRFDGLRVAICGDIRHSRVARSNIRLLSALGADLRVVGPPALLPPPDGLGAATGYHVMEDGIAGADVVMMLRVQRERFEPSLLRKLEPDLFGGEGDYHSLYGLNRERLHLAAPDALVMHPGPLNRGVEIASDVADDPSRSAILDQVENGVAVRMACLDLLTRPRR
jgi:aspartate carbamoyltransferase catalytic subunit